MRPTFVLFDLARQPRALKQWLNVSTPVARNIVRSLLKECSPINTHALFEKTQQVQLDPDVILKRKEIYQKLLSRSDIPPPENPLHPIRSLRYLKSVVMPDLVERREAEKIFRKREPTSEELELLAHTKPLTLNQRKQRGALGPGKRPPVCVNGIINEWLWSITDKGRNALPEKETSDLEYGLVWDKGTDTNKMKRLRKRSSSDLSEPGASKFMSQEDVLDTAKKWS